MTGGDLPEWEEPRNHAQRREGDDGPRARVRRHASEVSMRLRITSEHIKGDIIKRVEDLSGQSLLECYQCGKCSAGCPVVNEMDVIPSEVIRLLQLGQADEALDSKTIWICASCLQCASKCPKGVEFSSICDALRQIVLRKRLSTPRMDADEVSAIMVSDAPQMGVVGALRKLNG